MPTALQTRIDKERQYFESFSKPFLYQLVLIHQMTIRDFAEVFGISKNHAEAILKHRTAPSLELAFKIARYFSVTVDDLFGWRFDDNGDRSPLLVELKRGEIVKLAADENVLKVIRGIR